jgi:hypothetical protein
MCPDGLLKNSALTGVTGRKSRVLTLRPVSGVGERASNLSHAAQVFSLMRPCNCATRKSSSEPSRKNLKHENNESALLLTLQKCDCETGNGDKILKIISFGTVNYISKHCMNLFAFESKFKFPSDFLSILYWLKFLRGSSWSPRVIGHDALELKLPGT